MSASCLALLIVMTLQDGGPPPGPAVQASSSCARCHANAPRATAMLLPAGWRPDAPGADRTAPVGVAGDTAFRRLWRAASPAPEPLAVDRWRG